MGKKIAAAANPSILGTGTNKAFAAAGVQQPGWVKSIDKFSHPVEYGLNDMLNAKGPSSPGVDPDLTTIDQQMKDQANSFRQNINSTEQKYFNQAQRQDQNQLSMNLRDVNQNNSRRGLLYGGINAGQQAEQRAAMQSKMGQQRAQINETMENTANSFDQNAINTGLMLQKNQDDIQNQIYQQAMYNMMAQSQVFGGVMGGVGKIGGAVAGGMA